MSKDKIEVGDTVRVNFNNSQFTLCNEAIVLNKPCATGDSWIFEEQVRNQYSKELIGKKIHYVSEGCTITLINKLSNE
jgi:hypothetical protein